MGKTPLQELETLQRGWEAATRWIARTDKRTAAICQRLWPAAIDSDSVLFLAPFKSDLDYTRTPQIRGVIEACVTILLLRPGMSARLVLASTVTLPIASPRASDMSPAELVASLRVRGVKLSANNGRIHFDGPRGVMTDDLHRALTAHKPAILAQLEAEASQTPASDPGESEGEP